MYFPGMFALIFIAIRLIVKFAGSDGTTKPDYAITSELLVSQHILDAVELYPGKELMLVNRPDTFEVLVKVKGAEDFIDLGTIENHELAAKVRQNLARAKVLFVKDYSVKVELSYS